MAPPRLTLPALLLGAALLAPAPALAATGAGGPDMQPILLALVLMILGARLGGSAAERFGQPAVLGELAAGIAIGNLGLLGYHGLDGLRDLAAIQVFAQIGVLFLLFSVGLESDLAKMAAVPNAGAIYLCNPNNPTASITGKQVVRSFLETVPQDTIVLVDEAYFHYADIADYETVIPFVQMRPNLIVARTFSKIFGMAGIRCGYGIAQRSLIQRMEQQKAWDSMNVVALAGAKASLLDSKHASDGRKRNRETRDQVVNVLTTSGYEVVPSQANFFMVNIKRNVKPVIGALRDRGVHVGRFFPALPQHLRVTVGTPDEMEAFLNAFRAVMA